MSDDKKNVIFNGVEVISWWPEFFNECQHRPIYNIEGKEYQRVRYGDENEDWGADNGPCGDCAALKGQFHAFGCDVERCPKCGGQPFCCNCDYDDDEEVLLP